MTNLHDELDSVSILSVSGRFDEIASMLIDLKELEDDKGFKSRGKDLARSYGFS